MNQIHIFIAISRPRAPNQHIIPFAYGVSIITGWEGVDRSELSDFSSAIEFRKSLFGCAIALFGRPSLKRWQ
jgi:hypothetical protein